MEQMMGLVTAFILIFIAGIFLSFNFSANNHRTGPRHDLFARINGEDVTNDQFDRLVGRYRQIAGMGRGASVQQQAEFAKYAYQELQQEYAQAAAARAKGISVSRGEAEDAANKRIEQQLLQSSEGATQEDLANYRSALQAQLDLDAEQRRLAADRLREKITKGLRPVEVKVAHVLIKTDTRPDAAARKMADDLARRARAGEDFARLAGQFSEDLGSKTRGGEIGWASAMPPTPDPKRTPSPDDAVNMPQELSGTALDLRFNQVSDPVKSADGYHIVKVLQEREYQPKDPDSLKDPKKRAEAIESYKNAMAGQIQSALQAQYKDRVTVEPYSSWLKGYILEQQVTPAEPPAAEKAGPGEKQTAARKAQDIAAVTAQYAAAMKEPVADAGLAYRLAQLYQWAAGWYQIAGQEAQATAQYQQALDLLDKWKKRSGDAEMYYAQGQVLEALKRKTDAVQAYQEGMKQAFNNPDVLSRIAARFTALGRADLAGQASEKQAQQVAEQKRQQDEQQAQKKKMMEEQAAKDKPKGVAAPNAPGGGKVLDAVTVKTGAKDPKTGKVPIVSVTPGDKSGQPAKAGNAPAKGGNTPAATGNAPGAR
jgi:parvulin-like peptidyl-prolyl isomerase